jgi:hypothetical protein
VVDQQPREADTYRVVLLTKSGLSEQQRRTISRLQETADIAVVGIAIEDMIHGGLVDFTRNLVQSIIRARGQGYAVRSYHVARDLIKTLRSRLEIGGGRDDGTGSEDVVADIPVKYFSDMVSGECARYIRELDPDLGIVWGTRILPESIFGVPTDGSIGLHSGKIPEYRGGPAGFWEIYNGEDMAGVTVQQLNEDLDAGQIILQREVPIEPQDSPADVREKQNELTVDMVVKSVVGIQNGALEPSEWDGEKRPVNTPPTISQLLRYWWRRR